MNILLLLLLVPFCLMTGMAALATVAARGQLAAEGITLAQAAPAIVVYALGALLGIATIWAAVATAPRTWWVLGLGLVAALCMSAAPLLWGRAIDEFHLSHHLVRGAALLASLALLWVYVAAHR